MADETVLNMEVKPDATAPVTPAAVVTDPTKVADPNAVANVAKDTPGDKALAKYTDFTMPEGMSVDKATLDQKFVPLAQELKLSQEQAQKLVDLYAAQLKGLNDSNTKSWEDMTAKWGSDAKMDKEIGGNDFDTNLSHARKAIQKFGNQAFVDLLNLTGVGNHVEVIRFATKVGKAISEGKVQFGAAPAANSKSLEDRIYPTKS